MRYVQKTLTSTRSFELTSSAVRDSGRSMGSGSWETAYPLADLSPDVTRAVGRRDNGPFVAAVLLAVLFVLLIYVFQSPSSTRPFFVRHQSLIVVGAVVFIYALGAFRPKIEFTNFRWRSGADAFSVIKDRRKPVEYEAFVAAVIEAVARGRSAGVGGIPPLPEH